jgi:hypothetical protein
VGRRRVAEVVATPVLSAACRIRGVIAGGRRGAVYRATDLDIGPARDAVTAQLQEATDALHALYWEFSGGGGVQERR